MAKADIDPLALLIRDGVLPLELVVTLQLNRLSTEFERQWTTYLKAAIGISLAEWRILAVLRDRGVCAPAEAARVTSMHKALCSRAVAGIVARGLASQSPDPADSRATRLALTAKGKTAVAEINAVSMDRQRHVLSALTPEERKATYRAIAKMRAALKTWTPPA